MGLSRLYSRAIRGINSLEVIVEVHVSKGLPAFMIVGLPDLGVRESRERVRSAIQMSGFTFPPHRITVNLAPADVPKDSARYDLPIALGILIASGVVTPQSDISKFEIAGELALDGSLRRVNGALAIAYYANINHKGFILPSCNSDEAGLIDGISIYPAKSLIQVIKHITGECPILQRKNGNGIIVQGYDGSLNLNQVKGQQSAKVALEVAAAGRHSMLLIGNPGCGKSMLAERITSILPMPGVNEAIQTAAIQSLAIDGFDATNFGKIPFRRPHHSCTGVSLIGGGAIPKPGEISLAHNGVLFLDEVAEFERRSLEMLREPLETKMINLSKARYKVTFPADFQLIAAMNPCYCGNFGDSYKVCSCTEEQLMRYRGRISSPLLDRIDLLVEMPRLTATELGDLSGGEDSKAVQDRVVSARQLQLQRQGKLNCELSNLEAEENAMLQSNVKSMVIDLVERHHLSARVYYKLLKVARTFADLVNKEVVDVKHIAQAFQYRRIF